MMLGEFYNVSFIFQELRFLLLAMCKKKKILTCFLHKLSFSSKCVTFNIVSYKK